jgi:hypothetical protein
MGSGIGFTPRLDATTQKSGVYKPTPDSARSSAFYLLIRDYFIGILTFKPLL